MPHTVGVDNVWQSIPSHGQPVGDHPRFWGVMMLVASHGQVGHCPVSGHRDSWVGGGERRQRWVHGWQQVSSQHLIPRFCRQGCPGVWGSHGIVLVGCRW